MRVVTTLLAAIAGACVSCTDSRTPGVAFERSDSWRPIELASVKQRPPPLGLGSGPAYRARWTNEGSVRHVCLMGGGVFSLTGPWPIVVFSDEGQIVDENEVIAYTGL